MALVFEIASNLAMFRKGYTTTSMISYPFAPPTAVAGVIAAIAGIDNGSDEVAYRAQYWSSLKGMQIAVAIRSPILWYTTAVNLIKYKNPGGDMGEHIQPKHQFLKNPHYRVYVRGGGVYDALKARLSRGECVYTPYLGVAYAIAGVDYLGELFETTDVEQLPTAVSTVVPVAKGVSIDIQRTCTVYKDVVPLAQDAERNLLKSVPVLYSGYGSTVYLKEKGDLELSRVGGDVVAWFEAW